MPKLLKIVCVWDDAEDAPDAWNSEEEIKAFSTKECLVETTGYLYSRSKKYLTIAGDVIVQDGETTYGRVFKIPVQMVKSIKYL